MDTSKSARSSAPTRRRFVQSAVAAGALSAGFASKAAGDPPWPMEEQFLNPPDASKPWVYWWWLNGNVSREGITRDLEEMKRQGINGVLLFHAGEADGVRAGPRFLSPAWMDQFRFALSEAARLKMEVSINLCDGWDCGGPAIEPESAAKRLVFSEIQADGPRVASLELPSPAVTGGYYREVAVVAFRERLMRPVQPAAIEASSTVEGYCNERNWPPSSVVDGDPNTFWRSKPDTAPSPKHPQWILWRYHRPLAARSIFLAAVPTGGPRECELQASNDGTNFRTIAQFELEKGQARRVEFPETSAALFRLLIRSAYAPDVQLAGGWILRQGDEAPRRPGLRWWAFKSANRSFWDYPQQGPQALEEEYPEDGALDLRAAEVVDLSGRVSEGKLNWEVPEGRWTILRFGYTLLGQQTRASSVSANGYECDVLDSCGIERQFQTVAEPILRAAEGYAGSTLKFLHVDSYELGADVEGQQPTWSAHFRPEFQVRRGYDLLAFLPALAGRIVDSRESTGRFLWDIRRTIGDLMAGRFFGRFAELAHARGVGIHCETGYGTYPHPHIDGLECAGKCDVTMGEFWHGTDIMSQFDNFCNVIRSVSSAAHVYGRRIVQAESFTSWNHFQECPANLKTVGDLAFCDGLNRVVVHQYTHQPKIGEKPGIQYFAGTHLDRNLTWWEQGAAWLRYLARCQYLLQQGRFHADVCYFYGEGATTFVPSRHCLRPALPGGYNFDCVNADVLLNRMAVRDGRLGLADGVSYALLVLPEHPEMSPRLLSRVRDLVEAGATVLGPKPLRAPGLTAYPACDTELHEIARTMWRDQETGENRIGKGRLLWGMSVAQALSTLRLSADFEILKNGELAQVEFTHRSIDGSEVYFVSNQAQRTQDCECAFRVAGRQPELWDPVTGAVRDLPEFREQGGRTLVPLHFEACQSVLVVFRKPIGQRGAGKNLIAARTLAEIEGGWEVSFDPKWGGPAKVVFPRLEDWTKRPEEGIRFYSGKATYRKMLDGPQSRGGRIYLNLGTVNHVAEVRCNGKNLGVVWCAPWRVDVTGVLRAKGNVLEIDVVNLWPNRMAGDAALPPEKRFTKTNLTAYRADSPLLSSGLLGPVRWEEQA